MAASAATELSTSRDIPTRRVEVNDPNQLPTIGLSTTPGGTLFGTTPGGTRIIYDRKFLLQLRNSPLSKTPPSNLPVIPGVTCVTSSSRSPPKQPTISELPERMELQPCERRAGQLPEDQQFHMDV
ncbi:eukaryotic translation initiation factor 4E-binding protein 1-like [Corticium candelabrum]|uniref:eukaryotic translation initiation factor 4E-binding protein 1-like n=1 Tax=Corticium candelabrum TaxID=121492 RepID=UPI002E26B26B|nr:eukaryotic translation initiation factor 4E-binding protein 1-like [Corticium candelabrum]